jgi:hypothetical protein
MVLQRWFTKSLGTVSVRFAIPYPLALLAFWSIAHNFYSFG